MARGDARLRSVRDAIHGTIWLTDAEFAVMEHALFRRLKGIRQNGLLYLVFPSATHHRFEHSLGALHVADAIVAGLLRNSRVAARRHRVAPLRDSTGEAAVGTSVDLSGLDDAQRRWLFRVTRMAALVHDLGHGPLSHTFDSFALFRPALGAMLAGGAVPSLTGVGDVLAQWGVGHVEGSVEAERVPHEVMSCVLFGRVWQEVQTAWRAGAGAAAAAPAGDDVRDDDDLPLAVAAAVLGDRTLVRGTAHAAYDAWLPLVHDIVASAPADADRMDYLERDSLASGVRYGLYDRDRVLKSMLCYSTADAVPAAPTPDGPTPPETPNPPVLYRLGMKRSGMPALENFVQARYELFVQVYYHKTNQAVSLMLGAIARAASRARVTVFPAPDFQTVVDRYLALNDERFVRALAGGDDEIIASAALPADAKDLARAVADRRLWKRVYEGAVDVATAVKEQLDAAVPELLTRASEDAGQAAAIRDGIRLDVVKPKATKDLEEGARLLDRDVDDRYRPLEPSSWLDASGIIESLSQAEANIGRVYFAEAALASPIARALRKAARRLAVEAQQRADRKRVYVRERVSAERERAETDFAQDQTLDTPPSGPPA